ncbi:Hypothetical predicted protein [Podarcis lilfordi]|uniref:Uncharacterized protein n=1 Tax=Podarcis lilfordi TaxID=74358 RepID=A0AA35KL36_9SAUR|nr:Hypothetical predicted protein [Podarcis lilfordi]
MCNCFGIQNKVPCAKDFHSNCHGWRWERSRRNSSPPTLREAAVWLFLGQAAPGILRRTKVKAKLSDTNEQLLAR